MDKKYLTALLLLLICFSIFSNSPAYADSFTQKNASTKQSSSTEIKNILILNSYQSSFSWTDNQVAGTIASLAKYADLYNISVEYMDWKRYPTNDNLNSFIQSMNQKYKDKKIDLIITTDDAALSFAFAHRASLFSNAPIVFSGVNASGISTLTKGQTNYSGIMERIDPVDTVKTALSLNSKIDTVYIICDNSESGLSTGELCRSSISKKYPKLNLILLNKMPLSEMKNYISKISNRSMVLMTTYFSEPNGNLLNHQQLCKTLTSVSPVPIYHLYDFGMDDGIIGGKLISGYTQGTLAGKIALQVLNGTNVNEIPIIKSDKNSYTFSYDALEKYNIDKRLLPKQSIILHKPFSFFETYKVLVIISLVVFMLLLSFSFVLLFYLKKINHMKQVLALNNEELTQLYEELTASEEELRSQVTEIIEGNEKLEEYSDKLHHLAYHDTLTGLANRLYLNEIVESDFKDPSLHGAIFFIDLDNFKYVNDTLGHNIGDHLLIAISSRLIHLTEENISFIRLGGDEFIFYAKNIPSKEVASSFAKRIVSNFEHPFPILEHYISITVSIGIARFPEDGDSLDSILQNADMAMYKAKSNGKNGYSFYNSSLKEDLYERVNIELNMKQALTNHEFEIYYQPQIKVDDNKIDGFEALVRWQSPSLGFLSPLRFIPVSEETGFITVLGEWILRSSCHFIKEINEQFHANFKISVNISVIQLLQEDFEEIVLNILHESDLSPDLLELEITESVIMESPEVSITKLKHLRSLGIHIALDDFGTGYSSLSYLKNIPLTTLKIDKSFIDNISQQPISSFDITDTIIDLGHKLHLNIVAEGVETKQQLNYLTNNHCDMIQGYYFSKPLSQKDLISFIKEA